MIREVLAASLLPSVAWALPASERGALTGGEALASIDVSRDGRWAIAAQRSASASVAVWDLFAPGQEPVTAAICEAVSAVWTLPGTRGPRIFVGCADGAVVPVDVDLDTVPPTLDPGEDIPLIAAAGSLGGLAWDGGDWVFAAVSASNAAAVHRIDVDSLAVDGGGLPVTDTGTPIGVFAGSDGEVLLMPMSDGRLARVTWTGSSWSGGSLGSLGLTLSAAAADTTGAAGFFLLSRSAEGELFRLGELDGIALMANFADNLGAIADVGFVADGTAMRVAVADAALGLTWLDLDGDPLGDIELGGTGSPVALDSDPDGGVVLIAGGDGTVRVVTDRPWVSAVSVAPTSIGEGGSATVSFQVDTACAYTIRVGGAGPEEGAVVASGDTAAGAAAATVEAADLAEGENVLWVIAEAGGESGGERGNITLDTPPDRVSATLSSGDGRLELRFTASDEPDLDHYVVYLSDAVFDESALPSFTARPADGDPVAYPRSVPAGEPGTGHSVSIEGLENAVNYWVAVRAVDAEGNESPLSAVLTGAPEAACGLVECYGGDGCSCRSEVVPVEAVPLLPPALLWLLGRRRR